VQRKNTQEDRGKNHGWRDRELTVWIKKGPTNLSLSPYAQITFDMGGERSLEKAGVKTTFCLRGLKVAGRKPNVGIDQ